MWNEKQNVSHLRVFGGVCYPLIQKQFLNAYQRQKSTEVGLSPFDVILSSIVPVGVEGAYVA